MNKVCSKVPEISCGIDGASRIDIKMGHITERVLQLAFFREVNAHALLFLLVVVLFITATQLLPFDGQTESMDGIVYAFEMSFALLSICSDLRK